MREKSRGPEGRKAGRVAQRMQRSEGIFRVGLRPSTPGMRRGAPSSSGHTDVRAVRAWAPGFLPRERSPHGLRRRG